MIKNKLNKNSGFTLLEVMLVIIIIGTVSIFIPNLKESRENYELKRTISVLKADLRWARAEAILKNKKYVFRIYTISNGDKIPYYFYTEENDQKIIKRRGYYSAELLLYKTINLQLIEDEYYEWIRFMGSGMARGGTIGLSYPGGEIYSLTVNQLGRVRSEK
ncbi:MULTISPECIES: prepilin-type N-terminal cleavage/methylation domain-containing protein [unclassified Halanaerobium]|uniref:prepilin-type N-terminal cleavage/methylation domain-containing protein n=1 Tax=unclassified Halanaerobium TaxID=2641197 RepID=UPI000DF47AB0|nr:MULTISPECIES: prepilin-type N-terminal cleavage/methylation domain-containing protein [unclassified Halanaerobium]RCW50524.1 prepilin-type N-terminal cleavage/methylation domain-containing protein [Halanaerobium sp. MA284_MarDTE_T2]RCW86007.1 prepilin-type N-terminal cleavage/methylation domain-containing protein [Halanaerobium sp. DL-01]